MVEDCSSLKKKCLAHTHALSSVTADGVRFALGDKGDGTPSGKASARERYAHLNATHIPDLIRYGALITLMEFKCWSIYLTGGALGHGSARLGGAASEVEGWRFAFGREEALRTRVLGHPARGEPTADPLNRLTGDGRVSLKRGEYSDAADKGHHTLLHSRHRAVRRVLALPHPPPP